MPGLFARDGRAVVVAIDHPLYTWPCPGLESREELIAEVVAAGADALIASYGTVRDCRAAFGAARAILKLDLTVLSVDGYRPAEWVVAYAVEDAVRLRADAVLTLIEPGHARRAGRAGRRRTRRRRGRPGRACRTCARSCPRRRRRSPTRSPRAPSPARRGRRPSSARTWSRRRSRRRRARSPRRWAAACRCCSPAARSRATAMRTWPGSRTRWPPARRASRSGATCGAAATRAARCGGSSRSCTGAA